MRARILSLEDTFSMTSGRHLSGKYSPVKKLNIPTDWIAHGLLDSIVDSVDTLFQHLQVDFKADLIHYLLVLSYPYSYRERS